MFLMPQLSSIRTRFGYPYHQWMTQEFDEEGWRLLEKSIQQKRVHDVTLLIEGADGRFAMMSKHSYPPGNYRSPSGGIKPNEDFVACSLREAKEETGLNITIKRFLLHITLDISFEGEVITWNSYIFHATTTDTELRHADWKEIRETKWATRIQVLDLATRLIETKKGGLMYRGELTSASLWTLDHPLAFREAGPRDFYGIEKSLEANRMEIPKMEDTLWWIAEIQGLSSGTVGITAHEDCVELTGLTVDPLFRGKGLGHAMVEYACDQWHDSEKRRRFAEKKKIFLNEKLWLITQIPGYFLPVNFVMTDKELLPNTLQNQLTGPRSKWRGMRYQLYRL